MNTQPSQPDLKYLSLLAREYPNIAAVSSEIINLSAILNLPKGTEHFLSDLHGEHEAFLHMLRNASGVVREKIDLLFENSVPLAARNTLATLIYYPEQKLELIKRQTEDLNEWYKITLLRLVEVGKLVASKYTRSKVRKALPAGFEYIIDELLNVNDYNNNKYRYYSEIIQSIIDTDRADEFIIAMSRLIQHLSIDRLHILGDIYDRGPGAHLIMDALMNYHWVDIQWGNHDMLWMGAAAGCDALIATTIVNCIKYNNLDILEDGYGISLRPLATYALETYPNDPCTCFQPKMGSQSYDQHDADILAKMHKAMAILLFKLEGQVIRRHPEYGMDHRLLLDKVDFEAGTIELENKSFPLKDTYLPSIYSGDPYALSNAETDLMEKLHLAFLHSAKLQEHVRFLFARGSMYKICNSFLLYHGCIPMEEDGSFSKINIHGKAYSGKALLDGAEAMARQGYFSKQGSPEKAEGLDAMWYLWCGKKSPLFGKNRMATFERYLIGDPSTWEEQKDPYYRMLHQESTAVSILKEFGLPPENSHIVNGHVPVKLCKGESPIKAGGKLFVIDGGLSRAYQSVTGIAGYTLIDKSIGLFLACHEPFESVATAIENEVDIHSSHEIIERAKKRKLVADTDDGIEIKERINDLRALLQAFRSGSIKEHHV